jgi:hypothetical protein
MRRISLSVELAGLVFLALMPTLGQTPAETKWQRSARDRAEQTKGITWLTHEPPQFLARRGDHFDDEAAHYAQMYTPENLKRMAAAGIKYGRLYFYKGFGLEYEKENMQKDIQAAALMHQLGMKVSVYVGGTMFTETLYRENPQAQSWEQRDQANRWISYGAQTYRHYACPNEPAYRAYLKQVLKIAVEQVHADEIAFDNVMLQAEPESCHCDRCVRAFHEFLRAKYPTKEAALRRFGLPDVEWVHLHDWQSAAEASSVSALNDPVLQEWVRFRCESLADYANDLSTYVKSLNPNVAVHFNIKGLYSFNRYWTNAVYHPLFAGHIDLMSFDTGGYNARIDATTGALVSQIRSYKVARDIGSGCEENMHDDLEAAEHMAFGYETPVAGYGGAPWSASGNTVFTPLVEFFRAYQPRYYTKTQEVTDVAVLRNWPSMAYSISATSVPATLMEQVLIQYKVPFDILFDEQMNKASRYKAIILAGQESIADAQVQVLLAYVRNGGTLILAGNTAQYNEWRERRRTNPLLPARTEGKGRIVVIPRIVQAGVARTREEADLDPEPGATQRQSSRLSPAQWVLPQNHQEIFKTVAASVSGGLSIETDAPLTTAMELLTRPESHETIAHFVNYDRQHPTAPYRVTVAKTSPGPVKSVMCFSPDTDNPVPLKFEESGGRVTFTAPALKLYSMIVIGQ